MRIVVFILIPYKYMLYSQSLSEKEPKRERNCRDHLWKEVLAPFWGGESKGLYIMMA